MTQPTLKPHHAEAERFARLLEWGTRVGLVVLAVSFTMYLGGWRASLVPVERLPQVWGLPLPEFLRQTGVPTGWAWLRWLDRADMANLLGIGLLAGCSLPPLVGLIPLYLRQRDYVHACVAGLVALVLALAASGVLTGGR